MRRADGASDLHAHRSGDRGPERQPGLGPRRLVHGEGDDPLPRLIAVARQLQRRRRAQNSSRPRDMRDAARDIDRESRLVELFLADYMIGRKIFDPRCDIDARQLRVEIRREPGAVGEGSVKLAPGGLGIERQAGHAREAGLRPAVRRARRASPFPAPKCSFPEASAPRPERKSRRRRNRSAVPLLPPWRPSWPSDG